MTVSACQVVNRAVLPACTSPGTERLAEPKDSHQGVIDTPLLLWAHPAYEFTEPSCVNSAHLLNQDTGGLAKQVDLGAERGQAWRCVTLAQLAPLSAAAAH